ncbi:MAG: HAD family phosphatase [Treponema sp.]|jgi:putative hydrolase of the HAD superfamily|nr:HAD family phosphatase [Treponema sp.]
MLGTEQKAPKERNSPVPKAVVFDFGKVISFPPEPQVMAALAAIAGLDVKTMDTLVWAYRKEYDRGTLSGKDYYRTILGPGLDDAKAEALVRIDLDSWKRINPDTVTLMEDVKAAGYTLGILSNMPHDFLAWARESLPVFRLPHVGIFSCETGSIKPETSIYEKLLQGLSCRPEEVVFFDDMPINVEKACSLGIHGLVWQDPETARRALQKMQMRV